MQGESYPENAPSKIKYSADLPVLRGEHAGTMIKIFSNERDARAPRYRNGNTKHLATLQLELSRISLTDKIFSKKKRMGGHWYYHFDGVIEASYGSAWITYTVNLDGKLV